MEIYKIVGGKVTVVEDILASHEQEIWLTRSLDENCILFDSEIIRKFYVYLRQLYLALKLKSIKSLGNESFNSEEDEIEHEEKEAKVDAEMWKEDKEASVLFLVHVNNILQSSVFLKFEVYINNQQNDSSNGFHADMCYISSNFKGAIFECKAFLHWKVSDYEEFPVEILEAPLFEFF